MVAYIWPMALVVFANTIYQICAKSIPGALNPFASLIVTYLMGAISSVILYYAFYRGGNLLHEFHNLNWAPFVLGLTIVGLEVGFIYIYKAGWPVSTAFIVQSSVLSVALLLVGYFLYHEALSASKLAGIAIILVGLYFLNK